MQTSLFTLHAKFDLAARCTLSAFVKFDPMNKMYALIDPIPMRINLLRVFQFYGFSKGRHPPTEKSLIRALFGFLK